MNTFSVVSGKMQYTEDVEKIWEGTPLDYYPRIIDAAKALAALRETFDKANSEDDDAISKYHDTMYPLAIVLEIDGEPFGTVRMVDDMYVWIPFVGKPVNP